jgi:hypothetical protein
VACSPKAEHIAVSAPVSRGAPLPSLCCKPSKSEQRPGRTDSTTLQNPSISIAEFCRVTTPDWGHLTQYEATDGVLLD